MHIISPAEICKWREVVSDAEGSEEKQQIMHIYSNTNDHDKETPCPVKASTKLSTLNISDHTVYSKKGSDMVSNNQLGKIY